MAKTKTLLASALTLAVSLSLLLPAAPAHASTETATWLRVNIPAEGSLGYWVLADGSDIQHLTVAVDGTLYAYANPTGTTYTLFKSTDGGYSWSATGKVTGSILDIAVSPQDARYIYYATSAAVYKSPDAGNNFAMLPASPGGAGSNNIEITALDVAVNNQGNHIIAVATRDTDGGQYGGVYTLDEITPFSWTSTNLVGYDVYAIAFSPTFAIDRELVAVVTDEADTLVVTKIGDSAWGAIIGEAKLDRDNSRIPTPVAVSRSATIAFPGDYNSGVSLEQRVRFIAIDTTAGQGDVYRITSARAPGKSLATDLNLGSAYGLSNIDTSSIAASGSTDMANLYAGAASSAQVYFSPDGGKNWTRATKEPTGQSRTGVVIPPKSPGRVYAVTSGAESAFSYSTDRGNTWNELSLIDTRISSILDLALSPNYSRDNSLFLLTYRTGGKHSLWRSLDGGSRWERVFSAALSGVTTIDRVALSPQYGNSGKVVFLASTSGTPAVWQSVDNGQTFSRRYTSKPVGGASFAIDTWAVVDNSSLLIGSYDGTNGVVYRTANGGFSYSTEALAGSQSLKSIVLSPNYAQDKTLLVGNTNGWIYGSSDDGKSFQPLPPDATSPPLSGSISVAFDARFANNKTIYAASDSPDKGVYRYILGQGSNWEKIDSTLPTGGRISQLVISADGVLYAANLKADSGMERSLNPTYSLGPTFETVTRDLSAGATLTGLWAQGNTLWSMDTTNTRVMTYIDSLTPPASPSSPPENASGMGMVINYTVRNVSIEWEGLKGATSYQWQLDYDTNFSSVPAGFEGETRSTSVRLPALDPGAKYYWRVRAKQPVLSPWSPTSSFTTSLGSETIAPASLNPASGALSVELRPIFQWSAVPWGHRYELLVATDPSFTNAVIVKIGDYSLPATAWQCDVTLNYNTTYYWKVRATGSANYSPWSAVSAFTTRPAPAAVPPPVSPTPLPPPPVTLAPPSPPPAPLLPAPAPTAMPTTPDWTNYVIGALLLTIVLQSVILLALVITIRRLQI